MGYRKIGVLDMADNNNIISVLDLTVADRILETGLGAIGTCLIETIRCGECTRKLWRMYNEIYNNNDFQILLKSDT